VDVLERYGRERLSELSEQRHRESLRVQRNLSASIEPRPLTACDRCDIAEVLRDAKQQGLAPSTLRKWRGIIVAFHGWAYHHGLVSADLLLAVRAIPEASSSRGSPQPYSRVEIAALWGRPSMRAGPRLPTDECQRWLRRWREEISPYSRVRSHVIRVQLDAIVALALMCGLRRAEIHRLGIDDLHPDKRLHRRPRCQR
jgi:integrase